MGDLGVVFERLGWRLSPPPPDPALFTEECLFAAEEAAEQVVNCVHPTLDTEDIRKNVIDYIQRLIKSRFDCEVCPYGSVPLKTFLPDGDMDLTILRGPAAEETFPQDVHALLLGEEQNINSEFKVKNIQFIDAEVKLVKCLVQNIVIDLSFNQLGGLSTLCFLEQVDRLIGRNHLFKRSIVLVKAWCYFESRILGSNYGLLSTYALEVLVLYIFQMFHSSLTGPLAVLYRFMEYFGQFDWENYCISLNGPVCKSSLPDIVVKMPEREWNDRLLSNEFLERCMETFSGQQSGLEDKPTKPIQIKFLNIIDPLKENNNLGRSVHRGNFYRVRTALKYGARRLGQILLQPKIKILDDVCEFFSVTLSRHGSQPRVRVRNLALELDEPEPLETSSSFLDEVFSEEDRLLEASDTDFDDDSVGAEEDSSETSSEICQRSQNCSSSTKDRVSENFNSNSWMENRSKPETIKSTYRGCMGDSQAMCETSANSPSNDNVSEHLFVDDRETELTTSSGESEVLDLIDLTGDYESHVRNLFYGRLCNGCSSSVPLLRNFPPVYTRNHFNNPWEVVRQSMPLRENQFSQINPYMGYMEHNVYPPTDYTSPAFAFHPEGSKTARGTGTYFPNQSGFYRDRYSSRGRRTSGYRNNYRGYGNNNVTYPVPRERSYYEYVPREVPPSRGNRSQSRGTTDSRSQTPRPIEEINQTNSDLSGSLNIEFGSIGNLAQAVISVGAEPSQEAHERATAVIDQEKVSSGMIHLKNEEEFPALCARYL